MNPYLGHLKTICTHKRYVFLACCKAGIPWRGLMHDLSKFSIEEFWTSARYWTGKSSPISAERDLLGFSYAWQHHKAHNPHHWEYWVDFRNDGTEVYGKIPLPVAKEMVCDWLGAGKAYNGKNWNQSTPLRYFRSHETYYKLHPDTKCLVLTFLEKIDSEGENAALAWLRAIKEY